MGIGLDAGNLTAVEMSSNRGRFKVRKSCSVPISLNPLTEDPELIGREIRERLTDAGLKGKKCIVCLPVNWLLSLQVDLPELSDEDVESFLSVEAEREFAFSPEQLETAASCFELPGGARCATVAGIPVSRLERLTEIFKSAKLHPVSVTTAVSAVPPFEQNASEVRGSLFFGADGVDLLVEAGGGSLMFRRIELGEEEAQSADLRMRADALAFQLRISLGQLPGTIRSKLGNISIFGPPRDDVDYMAALNEACAPLGLSVTKGKLSDSADRSDLAGVAGMAPVLTAVLTALSGRNCHFEFDLQDARHSKSRLKKVPPLTYWLVGAATVAVCAIIGAAVREGNVVKRKERELAKLSPYVKQAQATRESLRELRPWCSRQPRILEVMRLITEAFPEEGTVWTTSLEIKGIRANEVFLSGRATGKRALREVNEKLLKTKGVRDLTVPHSRDTGEGAMMFSLAFTYEPGDRINGR